MKLEKQEVYSKYMRVINHFWCHVIGQKAFDNQTTGEIWFEAHVDAQRFDDNNSTLVFFNDSRYNEAACYKVDSEGMVELLWANAYNTTKTAAKTFTL